MELGFCAQQFLHIEITTKGQPYPEDHFDC